MSHGVSHGVSVCVHHDVSSIVSSTLFSSTLFSSTPVLSTFLNCVFHEILVL